MLINIFIIKLLEIQLNIQEGDNKMNDVRKRIFKILFQLIFLVILIGCVRSEYKEFTIQFKNTYLEIANSIDITDTLKTLKSIQSEGNKNRIENLEILLDSIQNKVPKSKKEEYERYKNWYRGLILLRDTPFSEWNNLSFEQKSNVWAEIGLMDIRKE